MTWWDDGPDNYGTSELFLESGWLPAETADTLRTLLKFVDMDVRPGNKSDAALILIEYELATTIRDENDPHLVWARHLLKEHL